MVRPPLGGVEHRGHAQDPAFAPDTLFLLFRSGSWGFFGLFVFCCPEFAPTARACTQLFLVPL